MTDAGAAALAAALAGAGAPDLIDLDLRGTRVTAAGAAALTGASPARRGLAVLVGPARARAAAPAGVASGADSVGGDAASELPAEAAALAAAAAGPLPPPPPPGEAERLLADARKALTARPPRLAAAAASLWALDAALGDEAAAGGHGPGRPPARGRRLAAQPPAAAAAVEKSPATLARALDAAPEAVAVVEGEPPRTLPSGLPLPAVGSHRVAAAAVLARLLALASPDADARLAAARALPRAVGVALDHGHCSPLHTRALAALASALDSPCERLWGPLLEPGGGAPAGAGKRTPVVAEAPLPLPARLAAVLRAAVLIPIGSRPPGVAFAAAAAAALAGAARGDGPPRAALAAALAGDPAWAGAGGGADALASLLKEQEGDLCGPRPERGGLAQAAGEAEAAALGVGRAIDGRELLQLLRSVRL